VTLAAGTFVLLIAGALVTSNDAGLAVPDWPTSFGSMYKIPPMVGGVKFEHSHRMVAQAIGFLTIIMAVWTWRADRRSWMRKLGWIALGTVIVQGVLGGTTVLNYLPPPVSAAHATLAQTFFCIVVLLAVFTSRGWLYAQAQPAADSGAPGVRTLTIALVAALYLQLMLGAAFRHVWTKLGPTATARVPGDEIVWTWLVPHVINAGLVAVLVIWTAVRVLTRYSEIAEMRRPAVSLLGLLVLQIGLGFGAYLTRVEWSINAPQPLRDMVLSTVAHLGVGALMLATGTALLVETRRFVAAPAREEMEDRKAVIA
jgi:cytochrome c oxidase assembly protein subunit 15